MRVVVLGAGVVGVAAAWYLAEDGHEVTVIDRRDGPALETSFANGGQISASHAEPWANPRAPLKVLKWLGREDAPLLFRATTDWRQWRFGLQFLIECLPSRTHRNTIQCLNLALYARECLKALRAATGIRYDQLELGILQFFTEAREFEDAVRMAEVMRQYGCEREEKSVAQCVGIEPALKACREKLVGGIFTPTDESGDAQRFTQELSRMAATRGTTFRWNTTVEGLDVQGDAVRAVRCRTVRGDAPAGAHRAGGGHGTQDAGGPRDASGVARTTGESITADAFVVALGSYSPLLLAPLRVPCPIYPAKGYSATIPIGSHRGAPTVSLTDVECKLVFSRLGNNLRVAGTAELSGYGTQLNDVRCQALVRRTFELFPDAGERERAEFWTGLRPAVPSNVPLVGGTRYRNLFLDTGHGTLGWTMACGSGRALADLIGGRKPEVEFAFT